MGVARKAPCCTYDESHFETHTIASQNDDAIKAAVKSNIQKDPTTLDSKQLFSLADIVQYGKFDASQDFQKSIRLFSQSIATSSDSKHIGECYLKIGKIYYEMKNVFFYYNYIKCR